MRVGCPRLAPTAHAMDISGVLKQSLAMTQPRKTRVRRAAQWQPEAQAKGAWWVILLCFSSGTWAATWEEDAHFLDGLRQRRLYSLAESYCRRRLAEADVAEPDLADARRIRLITELSRCYAERALHSQGADRNKDWARAIAVIDDWSQQYEQDSRYLVARVQQSLVVLARGELARQETEDQSEDARDWEPVRSHLRQSVAQLETVQSAVAREMRAPLTAPAQLANHELASLQANVQYQLSRAYRNRALTYAPVSADRISDLTLSLEQLRPLAQMSADPSIGWASKLDEIKCYRALGDLSHAAELAASLLSENNGPQRRLQVEAERIRLALAADNLPLALQIAESIDQSTCPAETDYAVLEMLVTAWLAAEDDQAKAAIWQDRIATSLKAMGRNHGAFWRNRGGALVASVARTGTHSNHLDLMVQTAQSLYASRQWEQAVQAYLRAAEQANALGDADRAFRLKLTAARIESDRGQDEAAIQLWRESSLQRAQHPEAPHAHWLAIGAAARKSAALLPAAAMKQYEQLLEEHLAHWPNADTTQPARWWLGQLREHRGDLADALEMYQLIPADAVEAIDAVGAIGRCWTQWLAQQQRAGSRIDEEAQIALQHFDQIVLGLDGNLPARWSQVARTAAVTGARLRLQFLPGTSARSEQILQAALRGAGQTEPGWRSQAQSLLVALMARTERFDEALARLDEMSEGSSADWDSLLHELSKLPEPNAGGEQQLAALRLTAATRLLETTDELTAPQRLRAQRIRAESMARLGQHAEAVESLSVLAADHPGDGATQESYARLLVESSDRSSVETALDKWRAIARRSRPKSERWYRAKYYLALAHFRLDDRDRCAEILRWVQAIPPGFAGTALQQDFEQLLGLATDGNPTRERGAGNPTRERGALPER